MACSSGNYDDEQTRKAFAMSLESSVKKKRNNIEKYKQTEVYVTKQLAKANRHQFNTHETVNKDLDSLILHIFETSLAENVEIVFDKKQSKTSATDITLISTIPTVADGSCGWRSVLTIIIHSIYSVYIPQHHHDFYKFIVIFKLIFYNYIVLLINSQHLGLSEFLSSVKCDDVNYATLDEYFTALLRFDYQLTLYELDKFVLFMGQTKYKQFEYINVLECYEQTSHRVVRSVYFTKNDDEKYDITKFPIIYLLNNHYTPVNECNLWEIPNNLNTDCRLIKHKDYMVSKI